MYTVKAVRWTLVVVASRSGLQYTLCILLYCSAAAWPNWTFTECYWTYWTSTLTWKKNHSSFSFSPAHLSAQIPILIILVLVVLKSSVDSFFLLKQSCTPQAKHQLKEHLWISVALMGVVTQWIVTNRIFCGWNNTPGKIQSTATVADIVVIRGFHCHRCFDKVFLWKLI